MSVHVGRNHHGDASLITAAQPSYDEQFRIRRRRYVIMMAMRVPFLIAAAALYEIPWLALTLILISVPLPWMAVLIANDGPAVKRSVVPSGRLGSERALPPGRREIVDSSDVDSSDADSSNVDSSNVDGPDADRQ